MEAVVVWVVIMLGAMAQGLTGLGFALISVPILVLFQDTRSVIVTTLILNSLLNALILVHARTHLSMRDALPLTLGSMLGVPFGSYLLRVLDPDALKALVAVMALLFSIPLLLGFSRRFRHQRTASVVAGAVSGALQSSTSLGAPPVVLLLANQGIPKNSFRAMLVFRSAAGSTMSVAALMPSGLVSLDMAVHALLLVPALLVGLVVGTQLLRLVPQPVFRRITLLLVFGAALVALATSFV